MSAGPDARQLLAAAGIVEDDRFVATFDSAEERAVLAVPQLITHAWRTNSADAFADVFTENGSLLMRQDQLTTRDEIHAYMSAGFAGAYRGARVWGRPVQIRFLAPGVALIVTLGGILLAGEQEIAPSRRIHATWVVVEVDGRWRLLSHHSSPRQRADRDEPAGATHQNSNLKNKRRDSHTMTEAAALVTKAKDWAARYGEFSNGAEGAVLTAVLRIGAAWEANDADAFAAMFVDDGSMLVGDYQMTDREQIRSYMAGAFAGQLQGTRLLERPVQIEFISDEVAFVVTDGGVVAPDETEVPAGEAVRGTWVIARQPDGDWRVFSYQSSPITG